MSPAVPAKRPRGEEFPPRTHCSVYVGSCSRSFLRTVIGILLRYVACTLNYDGLYLLSTLLQPVHYHVNTKTLRFATDFDNSRIYLALATIGELSGAGLLH